MKVKGIVRVMFCLYLPAEQSQRAHVAEGQCDDSKPDSTAEFGYYGEYQEEVNSIPRPRKGPVMVVPAARSTDQTRIPTHRLTTPNITSDKPAPTATTTQRLPLDTSDPAKLHMRL